MKDVYEDDEKPAAGDVVTEAEDDDPEQLAEPLEDDEHEEGDQ